MAFAVLALLGLAIVLVVRWRQAERRAVTLSQESEIRQASAADTIDVLRTKIASLEQQVARLAKWETVATADDEAKGIIQRARSEADRISGAAAAAKGAADAEIVELRRAAQEEATKLRQEARGKADTILGDANARLGDAEQRARHLVEEAERKAAELAGDSLKAVQDAKELERTVRALENVVEGYGDRYIVPTHGILDDLAEAYGHADAGRQLKTVRERIRRRGASLGRCTHVEKGRSDARAHGNVCRRAKPERV